MPTQAAIICRHTTFRDFLGERLCGWRMVDEVIRCSCARELPRGSLDLLIVDPLALAGNVGDGVAQLQRQAGKARIVLFGRGEAAYLAHLAMQQGLSGVLHEGDSLEEIQAGLRLVLSGGVFLSARVDATKRALFSRVLSEREVAIMAELALGTSNERLARRLRISVETVRTHRRNLMRKVGVKTQLELTRFAVNQGLICLEQ